MVPANDPELVKIAAQTGAKLDPQRRYYRFEAYRWGQQYQNPARLRSIFAEILEEVMAYSDGKQVLLKRGATWKLDTTIPT